MAWFDGREEMADANDATLSATLWAVLWGWLVMVFSTRGLVTASTVIYCVLFSVTNAAVMLDSLDYERVSAFNCVGVMVLLAVGISYVTLFGSAFREQVRKGINASHLTTLEVYLTVSQGILLTTLACCLAFFAMATSSVVFVSQLGYFLGVSMVLFYLNLHYIIIPMFLFTSWYALPRSWHMRVKMLRRHYMENCCASCVREAEHTAVEMVHHQHGDERSSQSSEGSHSVLLDDESKSDRDSQPEHDDARHVQAHAHARTHAVGAGDDDEAATVVTADHVRFASPGHESAAAHAVVAVPAGTVSGAPPVVEAAHPLELQVLQHSGDSGDEAGRSASRDAAGASDGGETRPAEGADVSAGGAGEGATGGGAGRSQGQETRPAGTLTRIRSLFSSRSNAVPAPTPSPNPAPATGDEHSVSSSSVASSKSEGRHMLAGRRPLKIYGFFVLCVTVAAFIASYIMSLRVYSIDYSFPQFLSSNSNLGEAVDAFLHYKSDVFATVYNKNDAVFAQATRLNAVGLNDVVNLEVRRHRRAQMKPALTPTPAASLGAAIGHSNATATGVGVEGVHKEEEDNRRALGSSSDYTDYTVLTCWGITKVRSRESSLT